MFINNTFKTKLSLHKSGRSTFIPSPLDINQVVESNSPTFDNSTSLPSSSKGRKLRLFSTLTRFNKTSLTSVFRKNHAIPTPFAVSHCTTSAAQESSSHILDVLEDGSLTVRVMPSPPEHQECGTDFGPISSTVNEPSNREDSFLDPDPPGNRIAVRVASLRMRTAEVWASIPATMDGLPASYSEASTPAKSRMDSPDRDETASIDHATMYNPSFSSPATSVTAVSDWSPQEWRCISPKDLPAPALDSISLAQPPEFSRLVAERPSERRRNTEETLKYNFSESPASGCASFPNILSTSSDQRANPRAASLLDSPCPSSRIPRTLSNTAACPTAAKQPFSKLPAVQLFTNSDQDTTTSSIRGSLTLRQRPLTMELPLRPWSCAKITRAKTKKATRKELLDKQGFFTRISHVLEPGLQKRVSVSF